MLRPYNLAFVVSLYTPYGGMQRTLLRIARECAGRGHRVDVLTGEWQGERPEGIGVVELDTRAASNHASNERLAEQAAAHIAGAGYDCVIGFTKLPGLDVYYAGDPCYAGRVDDTRQWLHRRLPRYRSLVRQEAAVFSPGLDTEIILIAHAERARFQHYYHTETARFHLLPPGINRERLLGAALAPEALDAVRTEIGLQDGERLILGVGSRFRTKGFDRLIDALAALPEDQRARCRLVIVGEGKRRKYARHARRCGVGERVVFTGAREDVAAFYQLADLLVHAPRSENTGTVLIEAMLFGLPVLVTANCGFAFHVKAADAGLICPVPFDQARLNAQLGEMLARLDTAGWQRNGPAYCERTDLYGLVGQAADVILQRAARNRDDRA